MKRLQDFYLLALSSNRSNGPVDHVATNHFLDHIVLRALLLISLLHLFACDCTMISCSSFPCICNCQCKSCSSAYGSMLTVQKNKYNEFYTYTAAAFIAICKVTFSNREQSRFILGCRKISKCGLTSCNCMLERLIVVVLIEVKVVKRNNQI